MLSTIYMSFILVLMTIMMNLIEWNFMMNWSIMMEIKILDFMWMSLSMIFLLDIYSILFTHAIFMITSMIFYYSMFYMENNFYIKSFFSLLMMFFISMLLLIFSLNIFSVMLGWDGLGITSLMLIFFYGNHSSILSSFLTFLITRLGDIFLIVSFLMSMNFHMLELNNFFMNNKLISIMFMISMFTKSAQFPFMSWLPMAMSAPTPISALVHSSTLVTAGIYLMIRFNIFLEKSLFNLIYFLSLFTMMISGMIASGEQDMKKLVAMSTLSQMGFMMFMISLKEFSYTFMHLIIHAMFKSNLFLLVGMVMKNKFNNQDSRMINMNLMMFPFLFYSLIISCFSLYGFPFLSGFLLKDLFMESLLFYENKFVFLIFWLSCIFTAIYSLRIMMELNYFYKRGFKVNMMKQNLNINLMFFMMNLMIMFMGPLMMNFYMNEEFFLFMNFNKMFLMSIYLMANFSLLFIKDLMIFIKNLSLSMLNLSFWSYKKIFLLSKINKLKNYEFSWTEMTNAMLMEWLMEKSKFFSFFIIQSFKMIIFNMLFMIMIMFT